MEGPGSPGAKIAPEALDGWTVRCLDCPYSSPGPYLTVTVKANKHSFGKRHHVQVLDPGGLAVHDMDTPAPPEGADPPF